MIKYKPEIDGLRAFAVISVIIYHAEFNLFGYQRTLIIRKNMTKKGLKY